MSNHPNRSRAGTESANPTPDEIKCMRERFHLSVADAAHLVHGAEKKWQQWEEGSARMHPGLWELFRIKAGKLDAN